MARFKRMTDIKDTEGGNFKGYKEENGGGSPKGGIWGGRNGRVGWSVRENSGEVTGEQHRVKQPRTDDGKFTYNSVNGKETKYQARGKTVNPLLTGGENGIYIDDVRKQFSQKSGDLYDRFKDDWYVGGTERITKEGRKFKVQVSQYEIYEIARLSFDLEKGKFAYEDENWVNKKGRHSKEEISSMANSRKTGSEQFVKGSDGENVRKKGSDMSTTLTTGEVPDWLFKLIATKMKNRANQIPQDVGDGTAQPSAGDGTQPNTTTTYKHDTQTLQAVVDKAAKSGVTLTLQQADNILNKLGK